MTAREVIAQCARAELDHLPMAQCKALADDILAALSAAGLRVVPVEPTNAMIDAAHRAWTPGVNHGEAHAIRYRAMLAAAREPAP